MEPAVRLSRRAAAGITKPVRRALLLAPATLTTALAACHMSPLTAESLYGKSMADAGERKDAADDRAPTDRGGAGGGREPDAHDAGGIVDVGVLDGAEAADAVDAGERDASCSASCGAGTQCDPPSGLCVLVMGEGMLSGVVLDGCDGHGLAALVGIAGRRQCSFAGKGAFFFSQLPLGTLELAAAKDGYKPFAQVVELKPGGTVLNVTLVRDSDASCAGQAPADTLCVCDGGACTH